MATKISFIKATVLPRVVGRVDYISNPNKQEYLEGFYQTPSDPAFWKELSEVSQNNAKYHKEAKTVEAREHIIKLPNDLRHNPQDIAEQLARSFKNKYGVECAVGIHWNKTKSNYHAHLVFSERQLLPEQEASIATRNTYFDSEGKRSSKAKCIGADGELLSGCSLVKKGEAFPVKKFTGKDGYFASREFLKTEKDRYARIFSQLSKDTWIVFNQKTNPHMCMLDLKRGEPEALRAWKERENYYREQYNNTIDTLMESGEITLEQALLIKREMYSQRAEEREERAANREEWKRWYAQAQERRNAYAEQRRREWYRIGYTNSGRKRTLIELVAILGLTVAGFDVFKDNEINNEMFVRPKDTRGAEAAKRFQYRIDQIYIAAGKTPPSELLAKNKIKTIADLVTERKPSLAEQMGAAEAQKRPDNNNADHPDWGSR